MKATKIEDEYPKLLNELNDSNSAIPAYARFQDEQQCLLRNDLKKLKAEHFKRNYKNHLEIPKHNLSLINHAGHDLDANKYFQLKYFLSEKDKLEAVK